MTQRYSTIIKHSAGQITPKKIIEDWNAKRALSSKTLSTLVPFISIIALFDDDIFQLPDSQFKRDLISRFRNYRIIDDYTYAPENIINNESAPSYIARGIPLGDFSSQLKTLNKKGGISIEELVVEKGNTESFNTRIEAVFILNDPNDFEIRQELKNLFKLKSRYIISWGWKTDNRTASQLGITNNSTGIRDSTY